MHCAHSDSKNHHHTTGGARFLGDLPLSLDLTYRIPDIGRADPRPRPRPQRGLRGEPRAGRRERADHWIAEVGLTGFGGYRALVSIDDWTAITAAAGDTSREVRIAVAKGLATVGLGGIDTVRTLTTDRDPLVRAAALSALGRLGDTADAAALTTALRDSAWQVRVGAVQGWAGPGPDAATPALRNALADPHPDVRKAAVLTLGEWSGDSDAQAALRQRARRHRRGRARLRPQGPGVREVRCREATSPTTRVGQRWPSTVRWTVPGATGGPPSRTWATGDPATGPCGLAAGTARSRP